MSARETLPIPERRTDLADTSDMKRRLLFVFVVLGAPGAAIMLLYGLTQHHLPIAIAGGVILPVALFLWWRRGASLNTSAEELRKNPFKPKREPEE